MKRLLPLFPPDVKILLVDDSLMDDMELICQNFPNVQIIRRKGASGLVSAIIEGMKKAVKDGAEYIVTMDGDGQHDPSSVKRLLEYAQQGHYDLVIGSRYVNGGGVDGFGMFRKGVSKVANYLFRISFDVGINDSTSGFRVYSRRAAEYLVRESINGSSYSGQVEIVAKLYRKGMNITEFPIQFGKRLSGRSKLGLSAIMGYFLYIFINGDMWKYIVVGTSGVIINELFLFLLAPKIWFPVADIIAIEVSIITNFMFNERWTFWRRKLDHGLRRTVTRFYLHNASSVLGLSVNFIVFIGLALLGSNLLLANLVGIVVAFSIRYLMSSQVIWVDGHR